MSGGSPAQPLSREEIKTAFERALGRENRKKGETLLQAQFKPAAEILPSAPLLMSSLLGLSDKDFVEAAYTNILKRRSDAAGLQYHLAALASGSSRITVLGELRYSPEGRVLAVQINGLRCRYILHRLYRLPLLGRLLRTLTGIIALPGLIRDMSRLWNELHTFRSQSASINTSTKRGIQNIETELHDRLDSIECDLEAEKKLRGEQESRLDQFKRRSLEEPWADPILSLAERLDTDSELFNAQALKLEQMSTLIETAANYAHDSAKLVEALTALKGRLGWPEEGAELACRIEATFDDQRNLALRALGVAEDNQASLRDQERRLSLILGEMRSWIANGLEVEAPARLEDHQDHLLDSFYMAFEDRFRGSRSDIKQRQRVYLDFLKQAGAGEPGRPIVDVGSGRGELLELLSEEGLRATGVDFNKAMVSFCNKAGLSCIHSDAITYLSNIDSGSLGAVTGFHIIEHLSFQVLVALFDASMRALAPGGVIAFETPNPANLIVASRWFYLDPTHRNPLPAEMVSMIAEARGFVDVSIRQLHPMQRRFEAKDQVLAAQLDDLFHGPQDYALLARRP